MFIELRNSGYDRHGQQHASGRFLLLMQPDKDEKGKPLRALVRFVALSQLGHFMMGFARIKGQRFSVSGAYGSDGLPMTVPTEIYELGTELPQDLYDAWNKGGGWNSAGSEAEAMIKWAKKTFPSK